MRFAKLPCTVLVALLFSVSTALAVPVSLTHTGRIFESDETPLEGTKTMVFVLYDEPVDGNELWSETKEVSFDNGYFNIILGSKENPIDEKILAQPAVYLSIRFADDTELLPRQYINSVPYSVVSGSVIGGVVDVSEIKVQGTSVVDSSGNWIGPSPDTLTNISISCSSGDVPEYNEISGWACVSGSSFDTTLTDSQVDDFVENSPLNLASNTTIDGKNIVTETDGSIEITGNYSYTPKKTYYHTISALAFIGDGIWRHTGFGEIQLESGQTIAWPVAPVHLPQHAEITGFSCRLFDNHDGFIRATLLRHSSFSDGNDSTIGGFGPTENSSSYQTVSADAISLATVDNSTYAYYIGIVMNNGGTTDNYGNLQLYWCRIAYELGVVSQ